MDPTLFQLTHQNQIVMIITFPPMARSLSFFSNQLCIILSLLFALTTILQLGAIASAKPHERNTSSYARTLDRKLLGLNKKAKLTHFKIYWHDIVSGKNPTSVQVVTPTNNSLGFGMVSMIDNPLTQGPDMKSSKMVGKAQGFYALASQEEVGLLMVMNFAFMEGKYNGSCITVLGRNAVFSKVREMPVIGGTGLFRFARGYVQARTHWFDLKTKDAIVEYNVYVLHY